MDRNELKERTRKYNSAFDLFEEYLPKYISDGCFVALLPYYLFYHMAYAAKLIKEHSFQKNPNRFLLWKLPLNRIMLSDDYTLYTIQSIPWNENYYKESGTDEKLSAEEKMDILDGEARSIYYNILECLESVFDCFNTQTLGSYVANNFRENWESVSLNSYSRFSSIDTSYFKTAYFPLPEILPVISKRFALKPEEENILLVKWFDYFYIRVSGKGLSMNKQKEFREQWGQHSEKCPDTLAEILESLILLENPTEYFNMTIY